MKSNVIARAQRMLGIGKDFDLRKILSQERAQTCAREKILVIGFEQMPGHDLPRAEVGDDLHVRHGKQRTPFNDAHHFAQKRAGIIHVLEHFDANSMIELAVETWEAYAGALDFSKRESSPRQQIQTMRIHFKTEPLVARFH